MNNPISWPNGAQAAVVVTVNFDGESVERRERPEGLLWGRDSYGRYGAQIGVNRLLDCLERHQVRGTFFVPGWDAESYPDVMQAIAVAGHELAGHGYVHEDFSSLSEVEQAEVLERSEVAFEQIFGSKPLGWRAPLGLMTNATRPLLIERGYQYDSSYCDDDVPYVVELAEGRRLVELPVFPPQGDRHYYALRRSPEIVARAWREEFEATYQVGGLFNLHLRPRGEVGSGRAVRARAVDDILGRIAETPNVWVTTCAELAAWALAELPTTVLVPA